MLISKPIQAIQNIPKVGPQQIGISPAQKPIPQTVVFNKNTISFFGRPYVPAATGMIQLSYQQNLNNAPKIK